MGYKHYVDENLIYLGRHGAKPKNAAYELPAALVDKAYKLENGELVFDEVGQALLDQEAAQQASIDAARAKVDKYLKRAAFASELKAQIAAINEDKNWSVAEVTAYLSDPIIQQATALIDGISFGSALALLQSADLSNYYAQWEMDTITSLISNYLAAEA